MRNMALSTRDITAFAGGAAVALLGSRLLQPLAGQAMGRARARIGADPLAWLEEDHGFVLGLLSQMAEENGGALRRGQLLFRVKRALSAHAHAEESAVYPLLHERLGEVALAKQLYAGHAEIKVRLHGLEEIGPSSVAWREGVNVLRRAIEEHVGEEERAFDLLRKALDREGLAELAGAINREKEMLL
jgi:hypothetical protein